MIPKHERFAREYVIDLNGAQAAIRAGYSENGAKVTGHRLLTDPNVRAKVAELQRKAEIRTSVTKDQALELLWENAHQGRREKGGLAASNQALAILAKLQGWESPQRVEQSGPDGGPMQHQAMPGLTDAEREREVKRILKLEKGA